MYSAFKKRQDAFEIELLKKYIKPGDTILDIGANIGFYAKILSELTGPTGKVYCFEPDKTNFRHLQKNVSGQTNIILNNKAVGPKNELLKIYTSKDLNVDHRTYKPEEFDEEIEIPSVSIDSYLVNEKTIDFIKMDIQGFELEALKGMIKTLEQNKSVRLISEFWPYGLKRAGSSETELYEFLRNMGFNCFLLERNVLSPLTREKVIDLSKYSDDKTHFFNIFATRSNV
jgi:FkbM family methyltransferase